MLKLWKYSNGTGHLIMSILMTLVGVVLVIWPNLPAATSGVGVALILSVQAAWFVPGAAKQVAHEVTNQITTGGLQPAPPPPAPPPVQVAAGKPTVEIVHDSAVTAKLSTVKAVKERQ